MILDTALLQQSFRQQEQLSPKCPMLGGARAPVRARNLHWRSRNGWSHQPVGTDISPRVFDDRSNGFEGNVFATGRANRLIAHPHRRRVGHGVEDGDEAVGGVLADVGTARG